jgi:hypothetical protein
MKKYISFYFGLLALITIVLMTWNTHERSFNPGSNFTGNHEKAIYYFPLIVLVELFLAILTIKLFTSPITLAVKLAACLGWMALTFVAFLNSIHGGGIIAAHALWLLVVSVFCLIFLTLALPKPNFLSKL